MRNKDFGAQFHIDTWKELQKNNMKIISFNPKQALKPQHRKIHKFSGQYTTFQDGKEIAVLRFYTTSSKVYACFWVGDACGSGYYGGYASDRETTAAQNAMEAAGFTFEGKFSIEDALKAVTEYFDYKNYFIHHAHP